MSALLQHWRRRQQSGGASSAFRFSFFLDTDSNLAKAIYKPLSSDQESSDSGEEEDTAIAAYKAARVPRATLAPQSSESSDDHSPRHHHVRKPPVKTAHHVKPPVTTPQRPKPKPIGKRGRGAHIAAATSVDPAPSASTLHRDADTIDNPPPTPPQPRGRPKRDAKRVPDPDNVASGKYKR